MKCCGPQRRDFQLSYRVSQSALERAVELRTSKALWPHSGSTSDAFSFNPWERRFESEEDIWSCLLCFDIRDLDLSLNLRGLSHRLL